MTASYETSKETESPTTPGSANGARNVITVLITVAAIAVAAGWLIQTRSPESAESAGNQARHQVLQEIAPALHQMQQRIEMLEQQAKSYESQLESLNSQLLDNEGELESAVNSLRDVISSVTQSTKLLRQQVESYYEQVRADIEVSMAAMEDSLRALAVNNKTGSDIIKTIRGMMPTLQSLPDRSAVARLERDLSALRDTVVNLQTAARPLIETPAAEDFSADNPAPTPEQPVGPANPNREPDQQDEYLKKIKDRIESR